MNKVNVLGSDSYLSPLKVVSDGRVALTHLAQIDWDGKPERFYVKIYGDNECKGLLNEFTCHVFAKCTEITVPSKACLIKVPSVQIKALFNIDTEDQWAWAVSEESGKTPNTFVPLSYNWRKLIRKIERIDGVAKIISFDQMIANPDRNSGNVILKPDNKNYCLIDHGSAPISHNWQYSELDPLLTTKCKLSSLLWPNGYPLPIKSKAISSYEDVTSSLQALEELHPLWISHGFCDEIEAKELHSFFKERIENHYNKMLSLMGMVI